MLISQTPFRMSFLGGGTDYKEYYQNYGGKVLSTTFNKYCYMTIRHLPPFFEHRSQVTYSKIERFDTADQVAHPAVREALKLLDIDRVHIMYDADLPARSGLGSSSSFAVGLLHGLHALRGEFVDKMTLSNEAIYLERELCNESGGVQDQLAVAFGGLNRIAFTASGFDVHPVIISGERKRLFNERLMLFFTGFVRFSSEIAAEQTKQSKEKLTELHEMAALVDDGERILTGHGDLADFGRLLDHTWRLKRSLSSKIATSAIDEIYARAKKAGATGGKLLGAGGGGFILLYVEPEHQRNVRKALVDLLHVRFEFEDSGSKIIYYRQTEKEMEDTKP